MSRSVPPPEAATHELVVTLADQSLRLITRPGFSGWEGPTPAAHLLAAAVALAPTAQVLLLGSGPGALGVALARRLSGGALTLMDLNVGALALAERTLHANAITNARVSTDIATLPAQAETFDAVVMELPQSRKLARRWLVAAQIALRPGGQLYLAGPNDQGIQSVIADAGALFGGVEPLALRQRQRVARALKRVQAPAPPAWAQAPGVAPGTWVEFAVECRGQQLHIASLPGVFAADRLDAGTALLLEQLAPPPGGRALDIGCGAGVIGLLAARLGAGQVDMVDANLLAVAAAQHNIERNAIDGAQAHAADVRDLARTERYAYVVTNPPFHAGKAADYDIAPAFIAHAAAVLEPGGRFLLVANRFLAYERTMRDHFAHTEQLANDGRYRVLAGTKT